MSDPTPLPSHSNVERAGWFTQHPVREEPVHVVTREWFDEIKAERDDLREEVDLAAEQGRLVGLEADRLAEEVERLRGLVEIIATNLESVMPESAATIRATLSKEATSA